MSKYYKAEDAIEAVTSLFRVSALFSGMNDNEKEWREKAEKVFAYLPTIDIVRCKDCKYWKSEHICIGRWGRYGTMMTEADAFCSYGEREGE